MTAAPGIETVESDRITFVPFERATVRQTHSRDPAIITGSFSFNCKSEQVSWLSGAKNFLHHRCDLLRREVGGDEIIFKRNEIPNVIHRFGAGHKIISFVENTVHCAVDRDAALAK